MAFFFPSVLFLLCFVKKLTVIGINGNTQGVSKAAKPDKNAMIKIDHNPFWSSVFGSDGTITDSVFVLSEIGVTAAATFEVSIDFIELSGRIDGVFTTGTAVVVILGIANWKLFDWLMQLVLHT